LLTLLLLVCRQGLEYLAHQASDDVRNKVASATAAAQKAA
jgi:hypothetical protein